MNIQQIFDENIYDINILSTQVRYTNLLCFKRLLKAEVTDTYDGVNNHRLFTSSYQPCWTGGSVPSLFKKLAKCLPAPCACACVSRPHTLLSGKSPPPPP